MVSHQIVPVKNTGGKGGNLYAGEREKDRGKRNAIIRVVG